MRIEDEGLNRQIAIRPLEEVRLEERVIYDMITDNQKLTKLFEFLTMEDKEHTQFGDKSLQLYKVAILLTFKSTR